MYLRSNIASLQKGGSIASINLFFSKSRRHVHDTLRLKYKCEIAVRRLLELGDLLWLDDEPGGYSDFYDPERDWCVAFGRDEGVPGMDAQVYGDFQKWLSGIRDCEFAYLIDVDVWFSYTRYITEKAVATGLQNFAYWVDEDGNQVSDFLPLNRRAIFKK